MTSQEVLLRALTLLGDTILDVQDRGDDVPEVLWAEYQEVLRAVQLGT